MFLSYSNIISQLHLIQQESDQEILIQLICKHQMTSIPQNSDVDDGLEQFTDPKKSNVSKGLLSGDLKSSSQFVVESFSFHIFTGKGSYSTHRTQNFFSDIVRVGDCFLGFLTQELELL